MRSPWSGRHEDEHPISEALDAVANQRDGIEVTPIVAYWIQLATGRRIAWTDDDARTATRVTQSEAQQAVMSASRSVH